MAKLERTLHGEFTSILKQITDGILIGSTSATLEECSEYMENGSKCSVRVFERYSWSGGNRLSLTITLFQVGDGAIHLSAITSGGSQGVFFKVNTLGEDAFLEKVEEVLNQLV